MTNKSGFTLIEILVVISIIAILSVVGVTLFTNVQTSVRDTKRRSDLEALSQAVRQYRIVNNSWPSNAVVCSTDNAGKDWPDSFRTALAPYMSSMPIDPKNGQTNACNGATCVYCFANNMWCDSNVDPGQTGPSCTKGVANFWTYQEKCSNKMIGDSARFLYGCNHFMKSIDP